jgi:hypothetical protein
MTCIITTFCHNNEKIVKFKKWASTQSKPRQVQPLEMTLAKPQKNVTNYF